MNSLYAPHYSCVPHHIMEVLNIPPPPPQPLTLLCSPPPNPSSWTLMQLFKMLLDKAGYSQKLCVVFVLLGLLPFPFSQWFSFFPCFTVWWVARLVCPAQYSSTVVHICDKPVSLCQSSISDFHGQHVNKPGNESSVYNRLCERFYILSTCFLALNKSLKSRILFYKVLHRVFFFLSSFVRSI